MDLLPYVKDFGPAGGLIVFFVLYIREVARHDDTRKQLIDLIPQCVTAIVTLTGKVSTVAELVRGGTRRGSED